MSEFITYKTSSPAGDCISFLAGIRQMWKETGKKAVIYQQLNALGKQGDISQPYLDEQGRSIMMGETMFNQLKPLVEAQEYVESYLEFKGEEVFFDLDDIRQKVYVGQPHGSLNRYLFYAFPQTNCDLSEAWLNAEDNYDDLALNKVIINFTSRYRNSYMNYYFLKKYEDLIWFAGLKEEYELFSKQWGLNIKWLAVDNFLELAAYIKKCKFFLGNQSMCFQIAEAVKTPRILEIFAMFNNVIPTGKDAYDSYHQSPIEFYFDKLINR